MRFPIYVTLKYYCHVASPPPKLIIEAAAQFLLLFYGSFRPQTSSSDFYTKQKKK